MEISLKENCLIFNEPSKQYFLIFSLNWVKTRKNDELLSDVTGAPASIVFFFSSRDSFNAFEQV
jgi:hypothetical protein